MEANAPGNVPGLQEAEARFYVEEVLRGRFPETKPQLPAEILAVFKALAATRGAEGTKAAFVLGNHADAIVATVYEPRDAASRGKAVDRRALQLIGVYTEDLVVPATIVGSVTNSEARALVEFCTQSGEATDAIPELARRIDRVSDPSRVSGSTTRALERAISHLRTIAAPQAVATRANALYGAFVALCPTMPMGTQLRVLLRWCGTL